MNTDEKQAQIWSHIHWMDRMGLVESADILLLSLIVERKKIRSKNNSDKVLTYLLNM